MSIFEIVLTAISLSMDAFAVAICKGLASKKVTLREMGIIGLWFGAFQGLMPLIGFLLASLFTKFPFITAIDHWIAFALLALIGANMIKESFSPDSCDANASLAFKVMLPMAIATSIDALAIGITLGLLPDVNIVLAVSLIGLITLTLSAVGVKVGTIFGSKYKSKAELVGGAVLVILGFKILIEHLFF